MYEVSESPTTLSRRQMQASEICVMLLLEKLQSEKLFLKDATEQQSATYIPSFQGKRHEQNNSAEDEKSSFVCGLTAPRAVPMSINH